VNDNSLLAPIRLELGAFEDFDFKQARLVCCYATTWASDGPVLTVLSRKLGRELPVGARVITVDKRLQTQADEFEFQLLGEARGFNRDTTESTGFVYKKIK